jgi:hypothetical protein
MKTNIPKNPLLTHEGSVARNISPLAQLSRSVMSCLLWEGEFYESGVTIAERIKELVPLCSPLEVSTLAQVARTEMKLRHVPLLIAGELCRHPHVHPRDRHLLSDCVDAVIQRPDELAEFCSIWQLANPGKPLSKSLSAQAKKGLAKAFGKFEEYALAKYNRDGKVKLRDVLFLSHPKPRDLAQDALWKRLIADQLTTPDTWEVSLSGGADKAKTFTRLLVDGKLGALALLRNLRNMQQAGVIDSVIKEGLRFMRTERVLPFRFISAAKHAPQLEPDLEAAMFRSLGDHEKLEGRTILLVDISGSMDAKISGKSDLMRTDAAYALAMLLREICPEILIASFSTQVKEIPLRRGFALRDAINSSQGHGGTDLGNAVQWANQQKPHRLIVITDEQSQTRVPDPTMALAYLINVASAKNGVGYGKWHHIDGWSEKVIDYLLASEKSNR